MVISTEKSDGPCEASQEKSYLGMVINIKEMTVVVPEEKLKEVRELIKDSTGARQSVKQKAKVVGKIISFKIAWEK